MRKIGKGYNKPLSSYKYLTILILVTTQQVKIKLSECIEVIGTNLFFRAHIVFNI